MLHSLISPMYFLGSTVFNILHLGCQMFLCLACLPVLGNFLVLQRICITYICFYTYWYIAYPNYIIFLVCVQYDPLILVFCYFFHVAIKHSISNISRGIKLSSFHVSILYSILHLFVCYWF